MLKRLYVDNYRCLVNFQLDLQELTLLTGPNGSGKSSVLDAFLAVRKLLSGDGRVNDREVFPGRTLTRWQQRRIQVIELAASLDGAPDMTYRLEIEHPTEKKLARISVERLSADGKPLFEFIGGQVQLYRDDYTKGPSYTADWTESAMARVAPRADNAHLTRFLDFMRGLSICAFNPRGAETDSREESSRLDTDGLNFASWYRYQMMERPDGCRP